MFIKYINLIYKNYIDFILYNLYYLLKKIISFDVGIKLNILNNIEIYPNLISLKSNHILPYYNVYPSKNINLYHSISIPIKFYFNNLKEFTINYNILNIPKINQVGDLLLNGKCRIPMLYLTSLFKYEKFNFSIYNSIYFIIKLSNYIKLSINITYENNICYIKLSLDNFNFNIDLYLIDINNIYISKYINLNIYNLLYIFDKKNYKKNNIFKKFKVFKEDFDFNIFFNELYFIEIFNILDNFINLYLNKKFINSNDNLISKKYNSIIDRIFNIFTKSFYILHFIKHFKRFIKKFKSDISLNLLIFREKLFLNPILQYPDQNNILSYINNKVKVNIFGERIQTNIKGFKSSMDLRNVQYDHLGILNMLYTRDGEQCGLTSTVVSSTLFTDNKIKSFFYNKKNFNNYIYLDILSKNLINIIFNNFTILKKNYNFKIKTIETLFNNEFKIIKLYPNDIYNYNFSEANIFSITELVIPFLLNNDPCRGLMGSKMHTQALPLIYSNTPYVITKYNNINSVVLYKCVYSLQEGIVKEVNSYNIIVLDNKNRYIYYYLCPYNTHDYNHYTSYKSVVWPGEKIYFGQILAVPSDFNNLEFTLGINNLVNYNFYYGFEHEDAVILNKDLIFSDILTSINFIIYNIYLSININKYIELTLPKILKYNRYNRFTRNRIGILSTKDYVFSDDILISKIRYRLFKLRSKVYKTHLKLILKKNKKVILQKKFLKVGKGKSGRLIKYNLSSYNKYKSINKLSNYEDFIYLDLKFYIASINKIQIGDKLCGRHGNKGVISKIAESVDLPYTYNDFYPYIITSPVGALARMNLGQFLEGLCGNLGYIYGFRIKAPINLYNSYLYSNLYLKSLNNCFSKYEIFDLNFLNKSYLRDFKTGYKLKNYSYFVSSYYFKLNHLVKDKFQYRTLGTYSKATQQPLHGKSNNGGLKFGEMEVWALEAHGASYNLRELILLKTNYKLFNLYNPNYLTAETFRILVLELKNILVNVKLSKCYKFQNNNIYTYC